MRRNGPVSFLDIVIGDGVGAKIEIPFGPGAGNGGSGFGGGGDGGSNEQKHKERKIEVVVWNDPPPLDSPYSEIQNSVLDRIQTALDFAGVIPVLGEPIDLINGGIYWSRGDTLNAGLSALSAIPFLGIIGTAGKFETKLIRREGTEVVERWMSRAELKATEDSKLIRGGRIGTIDNPHYVSDSLNTNALLARQRLALPQTPQVRVRMEVPSGIFSSSTEVGAKYGMRGGGMERKGYGQIPVKVLKVYE